MQRTIDHPFVHKKGEGSHNRQDEVGDNNNNKKEHGLHCNDSLNFDWIGWVPRDREGKRERSMTRVTGWCRGVREREG